MSSDFQERYFRLHLKTHFLLGCKLSMDKSVDNEFVTVDCLGALLKYWCFFFFKCSSTSGFQQQEEKWKRKQTNNFFWCPFSQPEAWGFSISGSSFWPRCFFLCCIPNILAVFDVGQSCENQCTLSTVNIADWLIKHVSERSLGRRLDTTRNHWYVDGVQLRNKGKQPSCGLLDRETDRTVANWSADLWEVFLRATGVKRLGWNPE